MDLVNELVSYNNSDVRVMGTYDKLWFCGIDVAKILGYKRPIFALRTHVNNKNKTTIQTLMASTGGVCDSHTPPVLAIEDGGQTIYIDEPGLYKLIFSSKLPSAEKFTDWVASELLPELRTRGQYKLKQTIVEKDNTIQENENTIKEKDEKIEQLERVQFQMQNFITNVKIRTQTEYIYIATTSQYAFNNNFKIGHTVNLVSRLSNYNTGRAVNDKFYYCYTKRVYEAQKLDKLLHDLLIEFKEDKQKENVIMHFSYLEKIIEFVSENFNESFEYLNEFIKNDLKKSYELRPVIPNPIDIGTTLLRTDQTPIKLSACSEKQIIDLLSEICSTANVSNLTRKALLEILEEKNYNTKGAKTLIWKNAKVICRRLHLALTY